MIRMDQYEYVRTAHRVYGKSIREISRETGPKWYQILGHQGGGILGCHYEFFFLKAISRARYYRAKKARASQPRVTKGPPNKWCTGRREKLNNT